jgi:hypothetical protein
MPLLRRRTEGAPFPPWRPDAALAGLALPWRHDPALAGPATLRSGAFPCLAGRRSVEPAAGMSGGVGGAREVVAVRCWPDRVSQGATDDFLECFALLPYSSTPGLLAYSSTPGLLAYSSTPGLLRCGSSAGLLRCGSSAGLLRYGSRAKRCEERASSAGGGPCRTLAKARAAANPPRSLAKARAAANPPRSLAKARAAANPPRSLAKARAAANSPPGTLTGPNARPHLGKG